MISRILVSADGSTACRRWHTLLGICVSVGILTGCAGDDQQEAEMGDPGRTAYATDPDQRGQDPGSGSYRDDSGQGNGIDALQRTIDGILQADPPEFAEQEPELDEDGVRALGEIAGELAEHDDVTVEVRIHPGLQDADDAEDVEDASELSEERAEAVAAELTSHGIAEGRIDTLVAEPDGEQESEHVHPVEIRVAEG